MKVFHICNDYLGSKVHRNLYHSLDKSGISQVIFVPTRSHTKHRIDAQTFKDVKSKIYFSRPLSFYHRLFFGSKIKHLVSDVTKVIEAERIDLIHATTLFSDGAVALRIKQMTGLPYIVTVRSTDLNVFLKYMYHLRGLGKQILENASKVVFVSESCRINLFDHSFVEQMLYLCNKSITIPNGIEAFWHENIRKKPSETRGGVNILYVGNFRPLKNVPALIKAIKYLNGRNITCRLTLIGTGGKDEKRVWKLISTSPGLFRFCGRITDLEELRNEYRGSDIFVLPSKSETFGLVYLEALSQGLPILYTKGQGIDGFFGENIGEKLETTDYKEIAFKLKRVIENYAFYDFGPDTIEKFNWEKISKQYIEVYEQTIRAR